MRRAGHILREVFKAGVLLFTAVNNWHLYGLFFTGTEVWYLQYLALLLTEGGLVVWHLYRQYGQDGGYPRAIALLMTCVCAVAVVLGTGSDIYLLAANAGYVVQSETFFYAVIGVVMVLSGLHITALLAAEILSDDQRQRDLWLESDDAEREAQQQIEQEGLKAIQSEARQVAKEIGPGVAREFGAKMRLRYSNLSNWHNEPRGVDTPAVARSTNGAAPKNP